MKFGLNWLKTKRLIYSSWGQENLFHWLCMAAVVILLEDTVTTMDLKTGIFT